MQKAFFERVKYMLRKPAFWIAFSAISLCCILFSIKYFPDAFPIINIDLRIDRAMALKSARDLAKKYKLGPQQYQQVASFYRDFSEQGYIELEAGGAKAYRELLKRDCSAKNCYCPYGWQVRHFQQGEINEINIYFNPQGKFCDYQELIPEDEPGARLERSVAQEMAEKTAIERLGISFKSYKLIEAAQKEMPAKRIDHTFTYERTDISIGEMHYRLMIIVSGDKVTNIGHWIKIPESFNRRYQEMRSANNAISTFSSISTAILYFLGGCIIGMIYLLRKRWVIWKTPLKWGLLFGVLQILLSLNSWSLEWMYYDTAMSSSAYLLQKLSYLIFDFLDWIIEGTLIFMVAESLTRRAFPAHLQFWKLWSKDTSTSISVLGRTSAGYLYAGVNLAYMVIFYLLATKMLHWWTPTDMLIEPNILATYFPWLDSFVNSLQAGFKEECLYRAIPLAGAALIGERLGKRRLFIISALLVQAIIFGSAHAGYANQPAYSRLVELIIPSIAFGIIYLYFGLLPGIIAHFMYDIVLFAIPIFVASSPGIWKNQLMVIFLAFIPLEIIFAKRLLKGQWTKVPDEHYNSAWNPAELKKEETTDIIETLPSPVLSTKNALYVIISGALALGLWLLISQFHQDALSISINKKEGIARAKKVLVDHGINISDSWEVLARIGISEPNHEDRFVWQVEGKSLYYMLMGTYLSPPAWVIRFVKFQGDVAERAEEYIIYLSKSGELLRLNHTLPEGRPAVSINEDTARQMALAYLHQTYKYDVH